MQSHANTEADPSQHTSPAAPEYRPTVVGTAIHRWRYLYLPRNTARYLQIENAIKLSSGSDRIDAWQFKFRSAVRIFNFVGSPRESQSVNVGLGEGTHREALGQN